jgi:hypothetical protein
MELRKEQSVLNRNKTGEMEIGIYFGLRIKHSDYTSCIVFYRSLRAAACACVASYGMDINTFHAFLAV